MGKYIIMTALTVISLISCNGIVTREIENNILDISVRNRLGTRTVIESTTLPSGSSVGLFVTDESGKTYDGNTIANVKFTATGEGDAQKWSTSPDVLLSTSVASVCSYYPYDESNYDVTAIPVEATSEVQKDWMWGTPVLGLDSNNPNAAITMNHALAAVRLNIIKGSFPGTGNVNYVSISSSGAASSAVMNATTGELSDIKGASYIFESTDEFTLSEGGTKVDFIVVPAGTEAPMDICVLVNGTEMVATTAGITLEAGKIYEYTVSVGVEALQLNKLNVTEWIEGEVLEQMFKPIIPSVNIIGNIEQINLVQKFQDGILTIKAIPKQKFLAVKEVTVTGNICNQSMDDNGVRTIIITDVSENITITFNGTSGHKWARIQHVDGTLYTAEEWLAAEATGTVTDADANGVAVKNSGKAYCPHVIHPTDSDVKMKWSSSYRLNIRGLSLVSYEDGTTYYDLNGKANTEAILAAVAAGTIADAPPAQYCAGITFANGQQSYLPAVGEMHAWYFNKEEINACMDAIGGKPIFSSSYSVGYWTSSLYSQDKPYYWWCNDYYPRDSYINTSEYNTRPTCALSL